MKKLFVKTMTMMLTAALALGISACGSSNDSVSEDSAAASAQTETAEVGDEADVVRIGYVATVVDPYVTLEDELKQVETVLAEKGATVEYYEFSIGTELIEALGAGEIDLSSTTGDTPIMTSVAAGYPVQSIFIGQEDPEGNIVVVAPGADINSVADLKGHKIGLGVGTSAHDNLLRVLETEGLTESDVELVNLGLTDGEAAITNGSVDAFVGTYPSIGAVMANTGATKLEVPSVKKSVSFVSGNTEFMSANPELTQAYVEALYAYNDYIQANREEVFGLLQNKYGLDDSYGEIVDRWVFNPIADDDLKADFEKTEEFLEGRGLIENSFAIDDFYTDQYAQAAKDVYKAVEK